MPPPGTTQFATRHDDKKQGVTVIVMQRINDNDLSAHVLKTVEEEYVHLKIEAEATGHQVFSFPRSPRVFTREPGDLLWESREGPAEIARMKAVMGKWVYSSQYQQDPVPHADQKCVRPGFILLDRILEGWHSEPPRRSPSLPRRRSRVAGPNNVIVTLR
jgi:hypothetical protein